MIEKYKNILNIKRPDCKNPMSMKKRAAQFSGFNAIKMHKEILNKTKNEYYLDENDLD